MAYRLSIIISLLLIGIVMLYLRRKEGWDWDRVVKLFSIIIITFAVFGGMGAFIYHRVSDKPEIQTSFWDINLESSKQTFEFIKGSPIEATDNGYWIYYSEILGAPELYFVKFNNNRLSIIGYMGGGKKGGPGVQGIKKGNRLDDVNKFFGEASQIFDLGLSHNKLYFYAKYNVFFIIKGNTVSMYGAYNPKQGPIAIDQKLEKYLDKYGIENRFYKED